MIEMKIQPFQAKGLLLGGCGSLIYNEGKGLYITHTVIYPFYILNGKLINYCNKKSRNLTSLLRLHFNNKRIFYAAILLYS